MIRPAEAADLPEVLALIVELAEFEHLSDEVVCTVDDLNQAIFGPGAVVHDTVVVAEDGTVAGHALWFRTFSTFLGHTGIWLEDLYVRPAYRRQGHAGALLADLRAQTLGRVEWDVLEWNSDAIAFYQGLGARPLAGWTKYRWTAQP
ncbi:MAG TPA: GNAT family N-acetyltransferase [Acidimicrobiales bacterium]|jgi:GNAT superfamily N-acetyltransferase|nr:GNAT family N-acetyltransferase [Acidimicrobiales bacterium]